MLSLVIHTVSVNFADQCCWPSNFRLNSLRNVIKSAAKTNFQSHSVFNTVVEGVFLVQNNFSLSPELEKFK